MTTAPAIDRRTWFTGFAIAITIALVAGLIASTGEVPGWEQSIFHAINDLPDWLEDRCGCSSWRACCSYRS